MQPGVLYTECLIFRPYMKSEANYSLSCEDRGGFCEERSIRQKVRCASVGCGPHSLQRCTQLGERLRISERA